MLIQNAIIFFIVIFAAYNILRMLWPRFRDSTRWITAVLNVLFLISLVFSVLVYIDMKDFSEKFPKSKSIFLLEDNGNIEAGVVIDMSKSSNILEGLKAVTGEELKEIGMGYKLKLYDSILGSNYKMFIVKRQFLENRLPEKIDFSGITIKKNEMLEMALSDKGIETFVRIAAKSIGITEEIAVLFMKTKILESFKIKDDSEFRAMMFEMAFFSSIAGNSSLDSIGVFDEYKDGNIIIYPETLVFRVIKAVPHDVYRQLMPK